VAPRASHRRAAPRRIPIPPRRACSPGSEFASPISASVDRFPVGAARLVKTVFRPRFTTSSSAIPLPCRDLRPGESPGRRTLDAPGPRSSALTQAPQRRGCVRRRDQQEK
jgi:hypothetical protein